MKPAEFVENPTRWIKHLGSNTSTFSAAPNFAYDLTMRRVDKKDLDGIRLDSVSVICNGAERVQAKTVREFISYFEPLGLKAAAIRPSYGMAEATLYGNTSRLDSAPHVIRCDLEKLSDGYAQLCEEGGVELVSCGLVPPAEAINAEMIIVDPESSIQKPDGQVGEIWLRGGHIGLGYWDNPEKTRATFQGTLDQAGPEVSTGPWLRSGDLGVVVDGELFITGRIKDMLIVDGRNIYPDDVEVTVRDVAPGKVAAISVPGDSTESLVIVAEWKGDFTPEVLGEVKKKIKYAVSAAHDARVSDVVLVPRGYVPITTSGKVQRSACVELYRTHISNGSVD